MQSCVVVAMLLIVLEWCPTVPSNFVIRQSEMPTPMNMLANKTATEVLTKLAEPNAIANAMTRAFEAGVGGCWNCVVVRSQSDDDLGWSLIYRRGRYGSYTFGEWHVTLFQLSC